jgi:8-oxo-dGTP pyrophosphatase MutT (NUDIX family)
MTVQYTPSHSDTAPGVPVVYTHPDVFTIGVSDGWADRCIDPRLIDWPARQRAAAIPFRLVDGRPVNPCQSTGIRYGRNELGHWGEQLCADAVAISYGRQGRPWLLMVERRDGHGWALPGGYVDPGEEPVVAAIRELREETGLTLRGARTIQVEQPTYVPDPRASDEAWMVTVPVWVIYDLDRPAVVGGDDARRAGWVPACDYAEVAEYIEVTYQGEVFPAHRDLLHDLLGH